jgi:hypothetical protein
VILGAFHIGNYTHCNLLNHSNMSLYYDFVASLQTWWRGSFDICGDVDTLLADNLLLLPGFFNWPLIVFRMGNM